MPSYRKIFLFGFFLVILIIALKSIGALRPAERVVSTSIKPFYSFFYGVSSNIKNLSNRFVPDVSLREENERLRKENEELTRSINKLRPMVVENERLKEALQYVKNSGFDGVLARIIGQNDMTGSSVFLINKGSKDGISKGDLVTNEKGELLGDIIGANKTSARLRLMTHPDFGIAVKRQDDVKPIGTLRGDFSLALELDLVPLDIDIAEKDIIVTSRINNIPENIVIGEIESVTEKSGELFRKATVRPYSDPNTTLFVYVIYRSL